MEDKVYVEILSKLSERFNLERKELMKMEENSYKNGYSIGMMHGIIYAIDVLNESRSGK